MSLPVVSEADIRVWCLDYLGRNFADASLAGDPDASFAELGLDSVHAAHFIVELDPELIYEHPTVADLARHVFARHFAGDSGDARPD